MGLHYYPFADSLAVARVRPEVASAKRYPTRLLFSLLCSERRGSDV
jgi:hypothetical protein